MSKKKKKAAKNRGKSYYQFPRSSLTTQKQSCSSSPLRVSSDPKKKKKKKVREKGKKTRRKRERKKSCSQANETLIIEQGLNRNKRGQKMNMQRHKQKLEYDGWLQYTLDFSFQRRGTKPQRETKKGRKKCGFIIKQSKWPPPIRTIVSDVK